MVAAYLRGQLKADYPQGFRSRLREEVIMSYLDHEFKTEKVLDVARIRAAFLPIAAKAQELCQELTQTVWDTHSLRAGYRTIVEGKTSARMDAIELYKKMALAGAFDPSVLEELGLK